MKPMLAGELDFNPSPGFDFCYPDTDTILDEAALALNICRPSIPGIYFLISRGEVVYVGQSTDVFVRLAGHWKGKDIYFDQFSWFVCNEYQLNEVEAHYIVKLKPKHNKTLPSNRRYVTYNQLKQALWFHLDENDDCLNSYLKNIGIEPVMTYICESRERVVHYYDLKVAIKNLFEKEGA